MLKIIKDSTLVPTPIVNLKLDSEPRQGSTDPVTSEGVKSAIDGAVGDASEALQEQIDDIAEKAGSGYTPKGEATVATLNGLSGQENGELYTLTDAGTLTDGTLAVVAGDTVAWDATNSVWYKAMDYAPAQYGTNEVHNLATSITAFRTGDVIPVDGPSGTAKMRKDDLLKETAENALAGNVFDVVDLNNPGNWMAGGVNATTGEPSADGRRLTTKSIPFAQSGTILYERVGGGDYTNTFYAYDAEGNYLGYVSGSDRITQVRTRYPSVYYFKFSLIGITGVTAKPENIGDIANFTKNHFVYKYADLQFVNNKINKLGVDDHAGIIDLSDSSLWRVGGLIATTGLPTTDANRLSTKQIPFVTDTTFSYSWKTGVSGQLTIYAYDQDYEYLGLRNTTNSIASVIQSFPTAYYFIVSLIGLSGTTISPQNLSNIVSFSGTYYQHASGLKSDVDLMLEDGRDVLAGKKWYACGDSFTAGNPNYIFLHGRYAGKNAVYPYFIGNRTSMDVHNIAVSGSTIAYKENYSTYNNCFSAGLYQTIPEDADYITLKFGINDGHQNIPIGTTDDVTNDTVCGAWNVVLSYLINKCPYAKIGVIVSNGCDTAAYSKAARDCAEKWGVSYIDENFDYKVPLLHRVNGKPLVSATAHQVRLEAFRVSENDTHPNTKAHEFESTFIESWLRTL